MKAILFLLGICFISLSSCSNSSSDEKLPAFRNLTGKWELYNSTENSIIGPIMLDATVPSKLSFLGLPNKNDTSYAVKYSQNTVSCVLFQHTERKDTLRTEFLLTLQDTNNYDMVIQTKWIKGDVRLKTETINYKGRRIKV